MSHGAHCHLEKIEANRHKRAMSTNDLSTGKPQRGVQSIEIGGKILTAFVEQGGFLRLKDLSAITGIATGKLHPYLVSFCNTGLLERSELNGYSLGPFSLKLGLVRLRTQDGFRDILRRLPDLAHELGLMISVSMWGPHGVTIVHIERVESLDPINFNSRVGGILFLTMTAAGHVFRAFLPNTVTNAVLEKEFADSESSRRAYYRVDRDTYDATIRLTQDRGYGAATDMPTPGISAVSAPVFDYTGRLLAAVTVFGPTALMSPGEDNRVASRLLEFTTKLSDDLGFKEACLSVADGPADP
jgi:DNA-binding IclR family transcriptional regulator